MRVIRLILFLIISLTSGGAFAANPNVLSINYSDGISSTIAVYVPASYVPGGPQKWAILLHGGGLNWTQYFYPGSPYYAAAETYGFILVGINGATGDSTNSVDWVNTTYTPNTHLEEGRALVQSLYGLNDYLPCLYGMSMGGFKTIHEMVTHPASFSAFGASVPPTDMIAWYQTIKTSFPSSIPQMLAAFGAEYGTSGNPAIDAQWVANSANRVVGGVNLLGRKLWIASGGADTVVPPATQYDDVISTFPAANIYASHVVAGGGHVDYGPTYISEIFGMFSALSTGTRRTFYASPTGSGDGLSAGTPASLSSALALVRSSASTSDVTLYLRGGTYTLGSTIVLTAADGGSNGHSVTWAAYPSETPVLSGGIQVTGWSQVGSTGIWQASVPAGTITRQLYVNGQRATRSYMTVGTRVSTSNNGLTYVSTDSTVPTFSVPTDLEFSNPATPWVMNRVSVASVSRVGNTTTWTMDGAVSAWNTFMESWATWAQYPFAIENAYEFLSASTPGCWYLKTSTNTLYYVPKAGENMATADVRLPVLQTLISTTQGDPASNIIFDGITFAHTGWTLPTTQKSYLQTQAAEYWVKGSWSGNVNGYYWANFGNNQTYPAGSQAFPPAAISLYGAQNAVVRNSTITHIGGMGVTLGTGSKDCTIDRNTISDVSANGVMVGDVAVWDYSNSLTWSPLTANRVSRNSVTNNTISNVAIEYQGGVGIFAGLVDNTKINHNEISGVPYTGISLGWGWTSTGYTTGYANSNEIGWNKIHDVMNLLYDGGGIYTLGVQSSSNPANVHDNYFYNFAVKVADTRRSGGPGAPLYGDQGTNFITYTNNVVSKNPSSVCSNWSLFNIGMNVGTQTVNASGNYATSGLVKYVAGSMVNGGTIANPTAITGTDPNGWPTAAQTIVAASGPTAVVTAAAASTATMRASFR